VKAAQIQGGGSLYIMLRHVLPNSISPIIILMMQNVGMTILMESGLSFLGIGITIPIPSWGTMVEAGRMYLLACPVLAIAPGACVALLVISLNLLGDGIRDALDPRLRGEV
jgi:ABC-type dipeptide/oligopeptide/nickel transport system permease subunit